MVFDPPCLALSSTKATLSLTKAIRDAQHECTEGSTRRMFRIRPPMLSGQDIQTETQQANCPQSFALNEATGLTR
jgi:hypothetical protein